VGATAAAPASKKSELRLTLWLGRRDHLGGGNSGATNRLYQTCSSGAKRLKVQEQKGLKKNRMTRERSDLIADLNRKNGEYTKETI